MEMVTEYVTFGVGVFLTLLIFGLDRKNKSDHKKVIKRSIKKTMQEVNAIFQQVHQLSNDYDYGNDERPTHKLTNFLHRSSKKIDSYSFIIQHNSSLITLDSKDEEDVLLFLELIDWFTENYTFLEKPMPRQILSWQNERDELYKNAEKIEEISEIFS